MSVKRSIFLIRTKKNFDWKFIHRWIRKITSKPHSWCSHLQKRISMKNSLLIFFFSLKKKKPMPKFISLFHKDICDLEINYFAILNSLQKKMLSQFNKKKIYFVNIDKLCHKTYFCLFFFNKYLPSTYLMLGNWRWFLSPRS